MTSEEEKAENRRDITTLFDKLDVYILALIDRQDSVEDSARFDALRREFIDWIIE